MSYYKDQLISWLGEKTFKSDRVLSVGCMNCDLDYFDSYEIGELVTLDNDKKYKPHILMDVNLLPKNQLSILEQEKLFDKKFDDVLTFELWEYIWNPMQALGTFRDLLKEGGRLWISAPFVYPTHNPTDSDYLRYTEYFWKKVLPEFGFEIEEYKRRVWREPRPFVVSCATDGMRPAKGYDHNITGHLIVAIKK